MFSISLVCTWGGSESPFLPLAVSRRRSHSNRAVLAPERRGRGSMSRCERLPRCSRGCHGVDGIHGWSDGPMPKFTLTRPNLFFVHLGPSTQPPTAVWPFSITLYMKFSMTSSMSLKSHYQLCYRKRSPMVKPI